MKIATFNANSIRSRLGIVLDWIDAQKPDVLCIQETKVQDQDFPLEPFESAGLHVAFKGQKAYNGVAIVSPHAIENVVAGFDDGGPADEPRLLRATVGPLTIVNTYVPQGREIEHEMYAYKLEWFKRLKKYFGKHCKKDAMVVWTGDLNVAAEPIDVHNPEEQEEHVCYHADVRKAFSACRGWGFTDVFRTFHPEAGHYTFFDYRVPNAMDRGRGWRLDYILVTEPLAACAKDAFIDLEPRALPKPSDHTFLVAEFDV